MDSSFLYEAFKITMLLQFLFGLGTFILLFFVNAPYGKHVSNKFGPTVGPRLGWILMEFPAFIVILLYYILGMVNGTLNDGRSLIVMTVFILVWQVHYIQRTFIFPFMLSKSAKPMALVIPLFGIVFNTMNGFINGFYLFSGKTVMFSDVTVFGKAIFKVDLSHLYSIHWLTDPRFIIGISLFILGFIINLHSDYVLRTLRKPGETGYKVPNSGFHKLLSNPNYFGELMEWTGWAVMTWSLPGLAFAVFTFTNLAPRAFNNRKWYRNKFQDEYPKSRKSIIPFIF